MRIWVYLTLATVIAYGTEWSPYYVSALSAGQVKVHGSLSDYKVSCYAENLGSMECLAAYQIPSKIFSQSAESSYLGIGIILSAARVRCADSSPKSGITFGDIKNASSALDMLRSYLAVDVSSLGCMGDLLVETWTPKHYSRGGHIGAPLVSGNAANIQTVKRIVEFFTTYIFFMLAVLLFALMGIEKTLKITNTEGICNESAFHRWSFAWLGFSACKSGLVDLILPIQSQSLSFVRLQNFFSICAHYGSALTELTLIPRLPTKIRLFLQKWSQPISTFKISAFQILALAIVFSPMFAKVWQLTVWPVGGLLLLCGLIGRDKVGIAFGLALTWEGSKILNIPYAPYGNIVQVFAFCLIAETIVHRIKLGIRISEVVQWSKGILRKATETFELNNLLLELANRYAIGRFSLLYPGEGGECRIDVWSCVAEKWSSKHIYSPTIPPVFAHVLATRTPLIHLDTNSELMDQLRGKHTVKIEKPEGGYCSVYPISSEEKLVGAVAFTGYSDALCNDSGLRVELEVALQFLIPAISACFKGMSAGQKYSISTISSEVVSEIGRLSTSSDSEDVFRKILTQISSQKAFRGKVSGYIAKVDQLTRRLNMKGVFGFSPDVASEYQSAHFYALDENHHGPMPLAFNRQVAISVPDLSWFKGSLHFMSVDLLNRSGAKSGIAIPIITSTQFQPWGVIWLESTELGEFQAAHEKSFLQIGFSVGRLVEKIQISETATIALERLVRKDIAQKLLYSDQVKETEEGLLIKIDIKGSSGVAARHGTEAWNKFVASMQGNIENLGDKYSLTLQEIIWDAFYFTAPKDSCRIVGKNLNSFFDEFENLFKTSIFKMFNHDPILSQNSIARLCADFGDVSRDIQNGSWTVIGATMVNVSKMENECKKLSGDIFFSKGAIEALGFELGESVGYFIAGGRQFDFYKVRRIQRKANFEAA